MDELESLTEKPEAVIAWIAATFGLVILIVFATVLKW